MQNILLTIHILAGYIGLVTAFGAIAVKTWDFKHQWHVRFGTVFFWCMVIVAISAIPLSLYIKNVFLLLIGVFSGYLTHGGWRFAHNHTGFIRTVDKVSIRLAMITGFCMVSYGFYMLTMSDNQGITLCVFGFIMLVFSVRELRLFRKGKLKNNQRIAMHLSLMLGAMIASVTAFVVTNFELQPTFILWLSPTIVIVPFIVYWNIKLAK